MKKKKQSLLTIVSILLGLAILGAGCSNKGYRKTYNTNKKVHLEGTNSSPLTSASGITQSDTLTPLEAVSSTGPQATGNDPLYSFNICGVGYNNGKECDNEQQTTITVQANQNLRLTFRAEQQISQVEGSGFSPPYSKLGVYIAVGSLESATAMLRTGLSGSQQTSAVMDFSDGIIHTNCAPNGSNPSCRETVTITIKKPNYDYWCFNYPYGVSMGNYFYTPWDYCPWTHVHETHPWNGTLVVETDDTVSID